MGNRLQDESVVMSAAKATMHLKYRNAWLTETADDECHNRGNRKFCNALRTSVSAFESSDQQKFIFGSGRNTMT